MNLPANQNIPDGAQALAQLINNAVAMNFTRLEGMLAPVCAALAKGNGNGGVVGQVQVVDQHSNCACKKPSCDGNACGMNQGGVIPVWNLPGTVPECYEDCEGPNKCLEPLLVESRSRYDDYSWAQLWVKDPALIHIDKIVSSASGVYLAAFPLTSNGKIILAQEDAQALPYLPGAFKVDWKFSVSDAKDKVIVRLFVGPRGLTNLTSTSGMVQIGSDLKLADFECKDDCYFLPYPRFLGCPSRGIPDVRTVYVELEAQSLGGGGNQLDSINFTLLKRGTRKFKSLCAQYKLDYLT